MKFYQVHTSQTISLQMIKEQPKSEIIIYWDMKGKSAQDVFEKVNLKVEDLIKLMI